MANTIKVKRGTNLSNAGTPAAGELIYKTDTNALYVGDGSTAATGLTAITGGGSGAVDSIANFADNRVLTASDADSINGEANLTFDGNHLDITSGHLVLPYGEINDAGTDMNLVSTNALTLGTESGTALTFANASLRGVFADDVSIPVAKKLYFGGGDHTYIGEDIDDRLRFFCGGDEFMRFTQQDAAGELFSIYQNVYMGDDVKIQLGSSQDLKLHHDATNSYIQNSTGHLYIQSNEADKDLV